MAIDNNMIKRNKVQNILLGILVIFLAACSSNSPQAFNQLLSVKPDTIKIDNTKDTLIFGSKGTALFFEKGSFQLPDGTIPAGKISILLKECYSNSDIIREDLTTTASGKLLETRGMINVIAFANDEQLILKRGKKFIIHFPKDTSDSKRQMNLFYGNNNANKPVDWNLDSASLLKPTAFMSGWMTTGYPGGDTSKSGGFYFKGQRSDSSIYNFFYKNFDNTKLRSVKGKELDKLYEAKFVVSKNGQIRNVKITENDDFLKKTPGAPAVDPYFYKYIQQIPLLEPFYAYDDDQQLKPTDTECSFYFSLGLYPPDYSNNKSYNKLFNKKYGIFKNASITSMNEAELNYYVFSASKLGWINCDFFWQVNDEKVDYYVKADSRLKPNIKLVFKQAKSILVGTAEGDNYVFKNVPVNQEIKIIAIEFDGAKPLMAIAETKTGKKTFEKLDYKIFTLSDLEKEINMP